MLHKEEPDQFLLLVNRFPGNLHGHQMVLIRRGNHYDGIIMDPPSYGRGPKGEIWKIEEAIHPLIKLCAQLLSDDPLFFLVNSYTTGLAPAVLTYMIATEFLFPQILRNHQQSNESEHPLIRKKQHFLLPIPPYLLMHPRGQL